MVLKRIKEFLLKVPAIANLQKKRLIAGNSIETYDQHLSKIEVADKVLLDFKLNDRILVGIVKDMVFHGDTNYISIRAYYPKYERFLKNNNIDYQYYDILRSDWINEAKKFDVIIWHTASDPATQSIAESKIYVLENKLGIKCLPNYDEIWSYEKKINTHYLYKIFDLPEIPTFVSHDKKESYDFINSSKFPVISKITTGSASFGVEKIKGDSQARKLVQKSFSFFGKKTYFPFIRQKNYVFFQDYIESANYDLRIITVGDKALGYYRYPNQGDFKASGAGNYEKKEIPTEALDLAFDVKEKFGSVCLATDLLFCSKKQRFLIIESSIFIGIDTPRQLEIDGVAGFYLRMDEGSYKFIAGKIWVQELTLLEFFKTHYNQ